MKLGTLVLVVILIAITGLSVRAMSAARRDLAVAEANTRAALDTTRITLRDSVVAATRLATQAEIPDTTGSGALAEALHDRDAALVAVERLEVSFDSLNVLAQSPTTDTILVEGSDSTRVATFEHEGPPIQGEQTVRVGAEILLDSRLTVSPFGITFGVACSDNAPVFAWDTPEWVRATFSSGTVEPDVCYTAPPMPLLSISTGKAVWFGAGVVTTLLIMFAG